MKVCADSMTNNKKVTVLQFKTGNFVKIHQKSIFSPHFVSFFCQKGNPLEPTDNVCHC